MKRTIEMILMTLVIILTAALVGSALTSCSSHDEDEIPGLHGVYIEDKDALYAIVKDPNAQLYDIMPSDWVLTLDDILAYNPETGLMKVRGGERIEEKSYPYPIQYRIEFYCHGELLFGAWLNNLLSSLIGGTGLMLYYEISELDDKDIRYFKLTQTQVIDENGQILEGALTEEEASGLSRFEGILKATGKWDRNLNWGYSWGYCY